MFIRLSCVGLSFAATVSAIKCQLVTRPDHDTNMHIGCVCTAMYSIIALHVELVSMLMTYVLQVSTLAISSSGPCSQV